MKVLEIILPVLVMILLGMACKRLKLLDQNGINNMKLLVTQIMLPVAIFHALATSEYNKETGILVGIMFVMLVVSFSIGFLLRPLMPAERYRKYLPFMVSSFSPWVSAVRSVQRASFAAFGSSSAFHRRTLAISMYQSQSSSHRKS